MNKLKTLGLISLPVILIACGGGGDLNSDNAPAASTEDPLAQYQWHLGNTGQDAFSTTRPTAGIDLNVSPAWASGITGKGVIVNVVDTGLEIAHPDMAANVSAGNSVNFGGGSDPTNTVSTNGDHGTSVAGLIAMVADNGIGGKGVAPDAKIMGHNYLGGSTQGAYQNATNIARAFGGTAGSGAAKAHIFNASYGMPGCIFTSNSAENEAYAKVKNLRSGKGGLIVKSAGNGFEDPNNPKDSYSYSKTGCIPSLVSSISNGNAAFDQANVVDNVIVVAAVNANGKKSSYSTTGANIWVSGIGGEYGFNASTLGINLSSANSDLVASEPLFQPAMITTDQSGCTKGYHINKIKFEKDETLYSANEFEKEDSQTRAKWNKDCNYTSTFNGTSSAAPTVSGVIALMLEANPNLTWRDVKHILAVTAKKVDANIAPISTTSTTNSIVKTGQLVEQGWVTNKANISFHNWYGFGLVDAGKAVEMAKGFTSLASQQSKNFEFTKDLLLNTPVDLLINPKFTILETAQIDINLIESSFIGTEDIPELACLQVELTSAQGTTSILLNGGSGFLGFITGAEKMTFTTNAFYGENPNGTWKTTARNICTKGAFTIQTAKISITASGRQTP